MKRVFISICTAIISVAIGFYFGKHYPQTAEANNEIVEEVVYEPLTEWQVMVMALAKTESEFNPHAVGKTKDFGILQITPIYVKEVNRIKGEEQYTHDDAFDMGKSLDMFFTMQDRHNPTHNIDKAIKGHNPTASIAYYNKVKKNMDFIRAYEDVRMGWNDDVKFVDEYEQIKSEYEKMRMLIISI